MSKKNKYDILNEVKKFPKVKTSDHFLNDLHLKLDKVIEEEKLSQIPSKENTPGYIDRIRDYFKGNDFLSGIFGKKYFIPAFATVILLIFLIYFYYQNNKEQLADLKDLNEKIIPDLTNIPEIKNPFIADNRDSSLSLPPINPAEELNKIIIKGKDVTKITGEKLSLLIKEKERELKLFDPKKSIADFGKFYYIPSTNDFKSIDLRSQTFSKERLEGLKSKIDSAMGK